MTVTKVRRLSNPHKKRRNPKAKAKRRKMSPSQIRHFGTKAQRAALKRKRSTPKRRAVKRNPKRKARKNPVLLTLGYLNPHQKGSKMAKRRKARKNPSTARRRRRNTTAKRTVRRRRRNTNIVVMGRRRSNPRRRAVRRNGRRRVARRNPMPGGGGRSTMELIAGGLLGVMAAKTIPGMILPASMTSSPIARALAAAATGYAAGYAAERFLKMRSLGEGITFGGFMEAGGILVTTYLPSISGNLGLGAIIPGYVNPPVNPVTYRPPMQIAAPAAATAGMKGVGALRGMQAAFGGAL
jgi:hypothetical protein